MLQDLEKGKRCEINAINGIVSAWGRKVKVLTPVNDWVVEIVRGIEDGLYKPGFGHLDRITPPNIPGSDHGGAS
jgi:2-dehydropantoate 2-reductase